MPESQNIERRSRYPSIRSFERNEANIFIGREQETKHLLNKVMAERVVLLFAKSGIGKSSLLNAGLSPLLENRGFLPIQVRLSQEAGERTFSPLEIIRRKLSVYIDKRVVSESSDRIIKPPGYKQRFKLFEYIKRCSFPLSSIPVLIFDQFEQFFDFSLKQQDQFLAELNERSKQLIALNTPRLGDSLLRATGEPWLNALISKAPKLDMNKLDQIAALPLGSNLKIDAWDDKVIRLNAKIPPIMNARDKMPFEVTPVFFRLNRFTPPVAAAPAAATGAAQSTAPAVDTAPSPNQAAATQPGPQ